MEIRGSRIWNGRDVTDQQSEIILNAVLDAGINFIDTAVDYGLSEERIGRYISSRRDEYFLATKCGCNPQDKGDQEEENQEQQQQNQKRQEQQPDEQDQRNQQEQQEEQQQQQQQPDSTQAPEPQPDSTRVPEPQLNPEEMQQLSKEDAMRILHALEEQEKRLQAERHKAAFRRKKSGKDW